MFHGFLRRPDYGDQNDRLCCGVSAALQYARPASLRLRVTVMLSCEQNDSVTQGEKEYPGVFYE